MAQEALFDCGLGKDSQAVCEGEFGWAIACGAVSAALVATSLLGTHINPELVVNFRWLELLLLPWWAAGIFSTTFFSPYYWGGSGYLGAWASFVLAWVLAIMRFPEGSVPRWGMMLTTARGIVVAASLVELLQTTIVLADWRPARHTSPYSEVARSFLIGTPKIEDAGVERKWCRRFVLSSGLVSLALCCFHTVTHKIAAASRHPCVRDLADSYGKTMSWMMALWWFVVVAVSTFDHPYVYACNGYFAAWVAFAASCAIVLDEFECWDTLTDLRRSAEDWNLPVELVLVLASSLAVLVQSAVTCGDYDCDGPAVWAATCSSVALLAASVCALSCKLGFTRFAAFVSVGLAVLWVNGTMILTFYRPYKLLGNGFVASWVSVAAAILYARHRLSAANFGVVDSLTNSACNMPEQSLLFVMSFVHALQGAADCMDVGVCEDGNRWSIICGAVGVVFLGMTVVCRSFSQVKAFAPWCASALLIWWAIGVGSITYFRLGGIVVNANVSSWIALAASWHLFLVERRTAAQVSDNGKKVQAVLPEYIYSNAGPQSNAVLEAGDLAPARFKHAWAYIDEEKAMELFRRTSGRSFVATRAVPINDVLLMQVSSTFLEQLENRRVGNSTTFCLELPQNLDPGDRRAKKELLDVMKQNFMTAELAGPNVKRVNILPVWHGATHAAIDSIATSGFATLADSTGQDPGYFGHGRYNALEAQYACLYASEYPNMKEPNGSGEWVVMLSAAIVMLAYPVTPGRHDFPTGPLPPVSPEQCRLYGRGFHKACDTHFVAVRGPNYLATSPSDAEYHEIVSQQDSLLLPLAKVYFKSERIP
eukprot:CAMPEP_0117559422 /NCGR_PEP_ID=MMETSP0784-20121206/53356_1 /TAXON_ID=39447 /ORGANISM="" /LENGTH=821 /DNA_ID=CAMNT_0005356807 /DNA_START=48 /DNA_END=2513 /DNA_ORIENTATION=+